MDLIQPCCIRDEGCFGEAAVRLWWKSLACLTQKVRLNCFNIYEFIYESWPWDLWMWHLLTSVGGDLCLKQIYFWKETCVATTPVCENLSWRALQSGWFCFLAECQFIFIAEGRTQLCILSKWPQKCFISNGSLCQNGKVNPFGSRC